MKIDERINPEVVISVDIDDNSNFVCILDEPDFRKVKVDKIPANTIVLKLDKFKNKSDYLNKEARYIHKGCDYCIISGNKVLLIELKSHNRKGLLNQYSSSKIFVNYILDLHKHTSKIDLDFEFIYILFSGDPINYTISLFTFEEKRCLRLFNSI